MATRAVLADIADLHDENRGETCQNSWLPRDVDVLTIKSGTRDVAL